MRQRTTGFCMRTAICLAAVFFSLVLLFSTCAFAEEKKTDEKAEWTILMYFCGSDLESSHHMASFNMFEMSSIEPAVTMREFLNVMYGEEFEEPEVLEKVNVVLETGGCKEWHPLTDMDISAEKLQRWSFSPVSEDSGEKPFTLIEDLPLASMSDPETLSDFIKWGVQAYPAEKYGLLLWDHGGGAMGLFVDELFDKDIMYLYELGEALDDAGVDFEVLILDACMMANLETARAVAPHVSYMVASEEVTSGYGSAFGEWLWALYLNPYRDGRQLGICVCDLTARKYAEMGSDKLNDLLTYSVLDLSYIDKVVEGFDDVFSCINTAYMLYPKLFTYWDRIICEVERYGTGKTGMIDIGSLLYNKRCAALIPLGIRARLQNALNDCVTYCTRGDGRVGATGLSFCLAVNMDKEDLDIYGRNNVSPHYLAYLDAISDWDAPEYVYDTAGRLDELDGKQDFHFDVGMKVKDGFPVATIPFDQMTGVGRSQYYEIYFMDENAEEYLIMRRDECESNYDEESQEFVFSPADPKALVTIEGEPCALQLVEASEYENLYNIPFKMNNDIYNFRCGCVDKKYADPKADDFSRYTVYGIWNGYDSDTGMPNRNVVNMSEYQGRDYRLLYP